MAKFDIVTKLYVLKVKFVNFIVMERGKFCLRHANVRLLNFINLRWGHFSLHYGKPAIKGSSKLRE